ncbi:hypothetical protein ASG52_21880 [Methylobacterium sp. Leaf456]|nr:hypothetical protein ASG52_21880 [Methylobacterium sp. Leaf456]
MRWRLKDLAAWIHARFGVSLDESSLGRLVKQRGFRKLSARPRHHEQDPASLTAFKKNLPFAVRTIRADLPPGTVIELWWQDVLREPQDEGPCRTEKHAPAALGPQGQSALRSQGSAHGLRLHLRGHLPGEGQRRRPSS